MTEIILEEKKAAEKVMSVGSWVGTILLLYIPFVNLVLLIIWAFGSGLNKQRANFSKATLIIGTVSFFLLFLSVFSK